MKKICFFIIINLLINPVLSFSAQADLSGWSHISTDLELSSQQSTLLPALSTQIYLVRTNLRDYRLKVLRSSEFGKKISNARRICEESRAAVCINASFFDEAGKPLGLLVSDGTILQRMHFGGNTLTGVFELSRNQMQISHRTAAQPSVALEAVQAGPRLIADGRSATLKKEGRISTRRSGVCIDGENRLVLFVAIPGVLGYSLENLIDLLMSRQVGCQQALNLDGGGSTQLYVSKNLPGAPLNFPGIDLKSRDEVPVFLGLFFHSSG